MPPTPLLVFTLLAVCITPVGAPAQSPDADSWTINKCEVYQAALDDALTQQGINGLSPEFLAANDRFVASGCTAPIRACPKTDPETALANLLLILTMNAGMASTFTPFGCDG